MCSFRDFISRFREINGVASIFGLFLQHGGVMLGAMDRGRQIIAVALPAMLSSSRAMTEGIVERHLKDRDWTIIELPMTTIGRTPLPAGGLHLDGAIVWCEPRDEWIHDLVAQGVKVVNCGTEWVGVEGVASVHFQYADLHAAVVRHLLELELRHVTAIGHRLDRRPASRRVMESFAAAARQAGMTAAVFDIGGELSPAVSPQRLLAPEGEIALSGLLKSLPGPAAIYCASDHMGFIVCEVAGRLGLRVPEDIAVVGMGDDLVGHFCSPPLTSVAGPARSVGYAAADCLTRWLTSEIQPFNVETVPGGKLIVRESTVGKSGSVVMEAVRRYISLHAVRGLSLGELVDLSGLSVKTLVRQYRAAFGLEPLEDVHQQRLGEARRLLLSTNSISDVAAACGFTSHSAFVNYFQRHAGCRPSDLRTAAPDESRAIG